MSKTPKAISSFEFTAFSQFISIVFFLPVYYIGQKTHILLFNFSAAMVIFGTSQLFGTAIIAFALFFILRDH